ncbi:Ppx/GppA family phosphatase [Pendulispora albinea]|uniref:Ppx/GppA family phosphatase n=1 Tax=Pendulispora albinea TaxID=2741071 RepID=A0ABZ2LUV9_9BACT
MTSSPRIAAIDIGTNTVLLLVAERGPDGAPQAVEEHATITRLGQGVDRTRTLHQDAIARTTACLDAYGAIVKRLGVERIAVVGTSAMRDARGGEVIQEHIRKVFGVDLRVIGGDEEAELTFAGALVGLPSAEPGSEATNAPASKAAEPDGRREHGREVFVFDIGGGSTEVVRGTIEHPGAHAASGLDEGSTTADGAERHAGRGSVGYEKSFDVGSVRLTERHVRSDPPSRDELDTITRELRATFAELPPLTGDMPPIGIAGTMTTLAAVSMQMTTYDGTRVHGKRLPTSELRRVVEYLASLPLAARREVPGLEPKRADVIVAGGLVALALLEHWGAESVVISDRGVRWGLAVALCRSAATLSGEVSVPSQKTPKNALEI